MARRVFFSFHYERDIWRANVVRNSWVTKEREAAGFWDASLWEEAQKKGEEAIKKMIEDGLKNTSVAAVLIGKETSGRKWVRYEVRRSHEDGKGLLAVYIHGIEDNSGKTDEKGDTYFGEIGTDANGKSVYFSQLYPSYDWIADKGYDNFGDWVEKAAKKAGR
jgi:hypothetical protein